MFRGVRGSYPVSGSSFRGFGYASTCCEVLVGERRLVFDAGSGIISLGRELKDVKECELSLFFTHFHIDHCYGMNFFLPLFSKDTRVVFAGPVYGKGSLKENLRYITDELINPVGVDALPCKKYYVDIRGGESLAYFEDKVRPLKKQRGFANKDQVVVRTLHNKSHSQLGVINYRLEYQGKVFVFATDIESDPDTGYNKELADFASGADLLAMDGQYTGQEYPSRKGWGHSTFAMACKTAEVARVRKLAVIHHDPMHDDKFMSSVAREVKSLFKAGFVARENQEVVL